MEDENKTKMNSDSYNFLLLSLYFYLKKNNFNETSEKLFQECKLDSIFKFPQNLKSPKTEKEKLTNEFIEFFYSNSFKNDSNFDLLGDFWNQFWKIFANKMNMGNNLNIETLCEKEEKNISKLSYSQNNISSNFINNNLSSFNNNENLKTINNLTNISKNTNNNINTDEMINIVNTSNDNLNTNINNINNNNYSNEKKEEKNLLNNKLNNNININNNDNIFNGNNFMRENSNMNKNIGEKFNKSNLQINKSQIYDDEEEEEEASNDIEREMDEFNGISFNNKNSPSIIKRPKGEEMPLGMYANEHDNEINKNLYQFTQNNSSSNFNLNLIGNQNNKMERNMSAIPLRKDVELENNNQEFEI